MQNAQPNLETQTLLAAHIQAELKRAKSELRPDQWQALLIGVADEGEIAVYPCRLILPFHYPSTIEELDESGPDHFEFPQSDWTLKWKNIPEFQEQYEIWSAIDEEEESQRVGANHKARRISVLQDSCSDLDPSLTLFGLESDSEEWWEAITFSIAGPRLPEPPLPISDIQLLSRLCRHTHSYIGESRFTFRKGFISEISFDGADTTDATIDLLLNIPKLGDLLRNLKKLSLRSTLVTSRSLRFLERELPHVRVAHSHFLEDFGGNGESG